jgi:hypothetical protein
MPVFAGTFKYVRLQPLFHSQITGPSISQLYQVPVGFWFALTVVIGSAEQTRATIGWVVPDNVPVGKAGLLRLDYTPGLHPR